MVANITERRPGIRFLLMKIHTIIYEVFLQKNWTESDQASSSNFLFTGNIEDRETNEIITIGDAVSKI